MARRIALRIARGTPRWISSEDLVSAAMVGLVEAADRYDTARSEPFVGFAEKRIRGAVLDELRRSDILPRRVRASARKVTSAIARLENKLARPPEDAEIAAELGVSLADYQEALEGLAQISLVELPTGEHDETQISSMQTESSPHDEAVRRQMTRQIRAALGRLDARDATLLSLYYVEELTYAEIGRTLGVSESRICQLHARALIKLRSILEPTARAVEAVK